MLLDPPPIRPSDDIAAGDVVAAPEKRPRRLDTVGHSLSLGRSLFPVKCLENVADPSRVACQPGVPGAELVDEVGHNAEGGAARRRMAHGDVLADMAQGRVEIQYR